VVLRSLYADFETAADYVSHADDDNHSAILMPHSHGQFAAILIRTMLIPFQPMPLLKRAAPFDDRDWIFELLPRG